MGRMLKRWGLAKIVRNRPEKFERICHLAAKAQHHQGLIKKILSDSSFLRELKEKLPLLILRYSKIRWSGYQGKFTLTTRFLSEIKIQIIIEAERIVVKGEDSFSECYPSYFPLLKRVIFKIIHQRIDNFKEWVKKLKNQSLLSSSSS